MEQAIARINLWIEEDLPGRIVTFTNVHMVVEARQDPEVKEILTHAAMNCPDGTPLYWFGRHEFGKEVEQVSGPDLMPLFCAQSVSRGCKHYLYGGAPDVVELAARQLTQSCPGIQIVGMHTPPFRPLSPEEDEQLCREINDSGADVVWVCLGCPKQEKWMYSHRDRLNAKVLLGVGQAIDILAGTRDRAPEHLRRFGLEWLYRFSQEPGRLWKRYLSTNFLFLLWIAQDAMFPRRSKV